MSLSFKRPENLTFPQIYYKFKAKDRDSDEIVEYIVQDLPENYFDRAVELFVTDFLCDEALSSALNIASNKNAVDEFRVVWKLLLEEKLSIACFKSDSDELVAANVFLIKSKDDPKESMQVNVNIRVLINCKYLHKDCQHYSGKRKNGESSLNVWMVKWIGLISWENLTLNDT
jgi:hypothetical protein